MIQHNNKIILYQSQIKFIESEIIMIERSNKLNKLNENTTY